MTTNRKQEIQVAAAKLFGKKGFAAASVRDIAQEVGLGAASLYNHMDSKDELLTTICFRCAQAFEEGMDRINVMEIDPVEKIRQLIQLQISIALHDESSLTVFNDEWRHLQEPHLSAFLRMRRQYETTYLRIIRDGMDQGQLNPGDPWIVFQVILSSLRWLHMESARSNRYTENIITQQITSIILKGIIQ